MKERVLIIEKLLRTGLENRPPRRFCVLRRLTDASILIGGNKTEVTRTVLVAKAFGMFFRKIAEFLDFRAIFKICDARRLSLINIRKLLLWMVKGSANFYAWNRS
jgi:hypothetical protein